MKENKIGKQHMQKYKIQNNYCGYIILSLVQNEVSNIYLGIKTQITF